MPPTGPLTGVLRSLSALPGEGSLNGSQRPRIPGLPTRFLSLPSPGPSHSAACLHTRYLMLYLPSF